MGHYRSLGCQPTYTCAPYQLPFARPTLGEQVAWGESNAIAFCNSVLGARTERYGDFTDIACAIAGRVPDAGLHRTAARRAILVLRLADDVPPSLRDDDAFYPVLGIVLGRRAGSRVAAIDGLPPGVSEDRLKAIGAAAASSGAVAMFHAVGSTPEAPTLEAALQGGQPEEAAEISIAELRAARDELTTASGGAKPGTPIGSVSLGTPHASLAELRLVERHPRPPPAPRRALLVPHRRRHHRRRRRGRPDRAGHLGPDRQQPPRPGPPGHRLPARQPRPAVRPGRQPGAAVRPGRQPGPADDPGRPPVSGGQDAAAAARPAELLRGPRRRHHGTADHRGHQGPAAPGRPAQTGTMTPATQTALARYLAHGNNQMAG